MTDAENKLYKSGNKGRDQGRLSVTCDKISIDMHSYTTDFSEPELCKGKFGAEIVLRKGAPLCDPPVCYSRLAVKTCFECSTYEMSRPLY